MPNQHGRNTNGLPLNEEFFDSIYTEEQAYWLGFLAADGALKDGSGGGNSKYVCLGLAIRDIGHLEKFKDHIDSSHKISVKAERVRESGNVTQDCEITIGSKMMYGSLVNHGLSPRKAHTVQPTKLIPSLQRHYWRGVFDGDGSITTNHQPRKGANRHLPPAVHYRVELGCNKYLRDGFYNYILNTVGYKGKLDVDNRDHRTEPLYRVRYNKINWVKDICSHLYLNSSTYLDRKYELAMLAINCKPVPSGLVRDPKTGRMCHQSELARTSRGW